MNPDIQRYFYHKDRARELSATIEAWYGTLDYLLDRSCIDLIKQRNRHEKIADNLIKKIDKEEK